MGATKTEPQFLKYKSRSVTSNHLTKSVVSKILADMDDLTIATDSEIEGTTRNVVYKEVFN